MKPITDIQLQEAIRNFSYQGTLTAAVPYGSGHINDTFLLTFSIAYMGNLSVILQRINSEIFCNPEELMENIDSVISFLREKIKKSGGNPLRETLTIIPSREGHSYYQDSYGSYWRSYIFITDASSYDHITCLEDFYESAVAFGHFQHMLSDYPAETLHETIRGFHDTHSRLEALKKAIDADTFRRVQYVQKEIQFVLDHAEYANILGNLQKSGKLPLRVTHNDTKLNNIMIDHKTRKGICVIDLDTVMPGLSVNDFGDSIRFGASTAAEDETDLSRVNCSMESFEAYVKGFLEGCEGSLTETETEHLPTGAKVMTYECGIRFLTDYLEGDHYFKIHRPDHNLDRCRTQFKLVKDMEDKSDIMHEIVQKYR